MLISCELLGSIILDGFGNNRRKNFAGGERMIFKRLCWCEISLGCAVDAKVQGVLALMAPVEVRWVSHRG